MVNEMGGIFPDDDAKLAKEKQQAEKDREKESRGKRRATMRRSISRRGFPSRSLRCAVARSGLAACIHAHFLAWTVPSRRGLSVCSAPGKRRGSMNLLDLEQERLQLKSAPAGGQHQGSASGWTGLLASISTR
jgi:hypothetical protein